MENGLYWHWPLCLFIFVWELNAMLRNEERVEKLVTPRINISTKFVVTKSVGPWEIHWLLS